MKINEILKLASKLNDNQKINKIMLARLLNQDLAWIYGHLETSNTDQTFLNNYLSLVAKYAHGYPLGYIFGDVTFFGHKILVDQNVLIPRNETEILVERTLFYAASFFSQEKLDVLDLCTGSGAIAVSLALAKPKWNLIASDVSKAALIVAQKNKTLHQIENINLVTSDLFSNLKDKKFDLIISNPPYINFQSSSYQIKNLSYEPEIALFAKNDGLFYYQKIFAALAEFTKQDFLIALEIGFDQKPRLEKILQDQFSHYCYHFEKDYQNHWRFLFISSKPL